MGGLIGGFEVLDEELDPAGFGELIRFEFIFEFENEAHVLKWTKKIQFKGFFGRQRRWP